MNKQQKEQIKVILEELGYKEYESNVERYFLPIRRRMKYHRKLTDDKIEELFGPLFTKEQPKTKTKKGEE